MFGEKYLKDSYFFIIDVDGNFGILITRYDA